MLTLFGAGTLPLDELLKRKAHELLNQSACNMWGCTLPQDGQLKRKAHELLNQSACYMWGCMLTASGWAVEA